MKRLLPALLVLCAPIPARAALNPETDKKYQLEVVLKCGTHNWLGDQFRNDLRSDLAGVLQDALGGMADVSVVDLRKTPAAEWKPLWKDFEARGFAALDTPQPLTGGKTHFLRIDFVNGQYELQARQFDGYTGMVGPLQTDRTADRALVTRLAGKLLAQDFGLLGTVEGTGNMVRIVFKGGALNPHLDRWVHKGHVFAVVRISQQTRDGATVERGDRIPDTLLRVTDEPKGGTVTAEVVYRPKKDMPNPLAAGGGLGFRCIKLGTTIGHVRLRLVDDKGQPHTRALQVRLNPDRSQLAPLPDDELLNPDPKTGLFVSKNQYQHMAYGRVLTGGNSLTSFPVEVYDDRVVTITVGLDPSKEMAGQLQFQVNELARQFGETTDVAAAAFTETNELIKQSKYDDALKRATAGRNALEEDLRRLNTQLEELKKSVGSAPVSLASCDTSSAKLGKLLTRINERIGELDKAIQAENDPTRVAAKKRLDDLNNKAHAQVDGFDFQGAIDTYKMILKEFGNQPAIKKRLDELEAGWALKNQEHQQARDFVYRDWPAVKTAADVEAKLPTARQKLKVLIDLKDKYTLAKFQDTMNAVAKVLRDEIQLVNQNPDADKLGKLKKTVEEFEKFTAEVDAAQPKK